MRSIIMFGLSLLTVCASVSGENLVLEFSGGVATPHSPFSSKWNGSLTDNGLWGREFALRGTYRIGERISVSGTIGRLENRRMGSPRVIYIADDSVPIPPFGYGRTQSLQKTTYFIPTLLYSTETIRLNLGTVIHSTSQDNNGYSEYEFPFDPSHKLTPVIGLELGEQGGYIFVHFLDPFPLYLSGMAQAGIGGRVNGLYEHKVFLIGPPFSVVGLGYRGEFRAYRKSAISFGLSFGGTDTDNVVLLSLGFKTII